MSTRLPPFRIGEDSGETDRVPASITLVRLHEALKGRDAVVTASAALRLLAGSDLPDKDALLAQVVQNHDLEADARRQAIILLGYANGAASQTVLLAELSNSEPAIQAAAAKVLGWIGGADAYSPLVTLMRSVSGYVARQAEWAARVIAHRERLPGSELPELRTSDIVPFGSERDPVRMTPARPERLRLCLRAIARRDFRLRFAAEAAHEVHCERNEWMLLPTEDAVREPASLAERRSIAAALASFIAEDNIFSIAMLALVEPGGRLLACRSTGEAVFAGKMRGQPGTTFSLGALTRPGAFPLAVEGSIANGALVFHEGVMGPITIPKRRPVPLDLATP